MRQLRCCSTSQVTLGGRPERGRSTSPWRPWLAKRCTHFRRAEYVNWSVSETCWMRWPLTTSRTAWARRKTRASLVCFKKVSKVGRAASGKCSLRVRMRVVSRIKYYKNSSTSQHLTWFLYYRSTAFPTQIFRKLLTLSHQSQPSPLSAPRCRTCHLLGDMLNTSAVFEYFILRGLRFGCHTA